MHFTTDDFWAEIEAKIEPDRIDMIFPFRCDICGTTWRETRRMIRDAIILAPDDPDAEPGYDCCGGRPRQGVTLTWEEDEQRCEACRRMIGPPEEEWDEDEE